MSISKDTRGTPITDASGLAISRQEITGYSPFFVVCARDDLGATTTGEDIWNGGAHTPVPPSAGERMSFKSSNVGDAAAGAGVRTARIEYLDENGLEQTEDITLAGSATAVTSGTMSFINDFYALTVGTSGTAIGNITIFSTDSVGLIYNRIDASGNKSLNSQRKVPSNKTMFITWVDASESNNKETTVRLRANCAPSGMVVGSLDTFLFKKNVLLKQQNAGFVISPPIPVCAGGLVKMTGWAVGASGQVAGNYQGYLVTD